MICVKPPASVLSQVALHKKSDQKSDAVVNEDFLVSFCQSFETKKSYFAHKKRSLAILFVQSRSH